MKKKIIAIILALIMLLGLVACGEAKPKKIADDAFTIPSVGISDVSGEYTKTSSGYHFEIKCKKASNLTCKEVVFHSTYVVSPTESADGDYDIIVFDWETGNKLSLIDVIFFAEDKEICRLSIQSAKLGIENL